MNIKENFTYTKKISKFKLFLDKNLLWKMTLAK